MSKEAQQQRLSRRAERRVAAQRAARRRKFMQFGGAIVLALIVAVVLIIVNRPTDVSDVQAAEAPPADIPTDGRTMGDPNAPVRVVEWGDYR